MVREGGGGTLWHWSRYALQFMEDPTMSCWMIPDGIVSHGEPMLEQVFPEGLQPMGRNHARAEE